MNGLLMCEGQARERNVLCSAREPRTGFAKRRAALVSEVEDIRCLFLYDKSIEYKEPNVLFGRGVETSLNK